MRGLTENEAWCLAMDKDAEFSDDETHATLVELERRGLMVSRCVTLHYGEEWDEWEKTQLGIDALRIYRAVRAWS